jgi:hypothetical protein
MDAKTCLTASLYAAAAASLAFMFHEVIDQSRHTIPLPVEAELYVSPPGCSSSADHYASELPTACFISKYYIENSKDLGLGGTARNQKWFRIGNDAIFVACSSGPTCHRFITVEGIFIQKPESIRSHS